MDKTQDITPKKIKERIVDMPSGEKITIRMQQTEAEVTKVVHEVDLPIHVSVSGTFTASSAVTANTE